MYYHQNSLKFDLNEIIILWFYEHYTLSLLMSFSFIIYMIKFYSNMVKLFINFMIISNL